MVKKMELPSLARLKDGRFFYKDGDSGDIVVESTVLPHTFIGVGETIEEALASFNKHAEIVYKEAVKNNIAGYDFV